jgi:hypothetical protein
MRHKNLFLLAKLPTHFKSIIGWSGSDANGYITQISDIKIPAGTILLVPACNVDVVEKIDDFDILGSSPGRRCGEPEFEAIDAESFLGAEKFPGVINAATLINRDRRFSQERYHIMANSLGDNFRVRNHILLC